MYGQEAINATSFDHPDRASHLNNLGSSYGHKYTRTGSIDDLTQAITHAQEAVKATPLNHPDRAMYLNNLGSSLGARYSRTGSMTDLEQATPCIQEAVDLTPLDHTGRAMYLNNLGNNLRDRYNRTGSIDDLEQAILHAQEAIEATPFDHPDRAMYLNNLGIKFEDRYVRTGDKGDDEKALQLFEDGARCSTSLPILRAHSGRNAIRKFHRNNDWKKAAAVADTLFGLLPYCCGRYIGRNDQQHALKQIAGFAADVCSLSLRLGDPHQALQRVEFGRALILGYLMDGRSDISELTLAHPSLAREYDELRVRIFNKMS